MNNNNLLIIDHESYEEEIVFYENECNREMGRPHKEEVVIITGSIIVSP